jgi:hypothetical protein
LGKWHADAFVVILANAGIQIFRRLLDLGSSLRFDRDDAFFTLRAFFRSLPRAARGSFAVPVRRDDDAIG